MEVTAVRSGEKIPFELESGCLCLVNACISMHFAWFRADITDALWPMVEDALQWTLNGKCSDIFSRSAASSSVDNLCHAFSLNET